MNYVFICIGTNELIEDSFGPRVGDILKKNFKNNNIKVLGTMKNPIHFQNAPIFLDDLKQENNMIIAIDSALGEKWQIGNTYINTGGLEIGKAFGRSFYFPAHLNIKTIVGIKPEIKSTKINNKNATNRILRINKMSQILAHQILYAMPEMI